LGVSYIQGESVREISPIEMVGFIPVFVDEMFPVIVQA
jgi:hypothetical protein